MPLPFFEAKTAPTSKPETDTSDTTASPHNSSLITADGNVDLAATSDQPTVPSLDKTEPLEVVKQTIDDLEAQGLLMLFDRHDQVAKRLTGDLMAAGVLQEEVQPRQQEACSQR